ncbi:hypothetical protein, partial [Salmonella enterica]|uniref:hypothetical protein n=1 Tax=Salmonella enterica TaxID=28901 RepID=UPI0020C58BFB
ETKKKKKNHGRPFIQRMASQSKKLDAPRARATKPRRAVPLREKPEPVQVQSEPDRTKDKPEEQGREREK